MDPNNSVIKRLWCNIYNESSVSLSLSVGLDNGPETGT